MKGLRLPRMSKSCGDRGSARASQTCGEHVIWDEEFTSPELGCRCPWTDSSEWHRRWVSARSNKDCSCAVSLTGTVSSLMGFLQSQGHMLHTTSHSCSCPCFHKDILQSAHTCEGDRAFLFDVSNHMPQEVSASPNVVGDFSRRYNAGESN